jgi:GDP-L-fucose synthase
MKKILLTGAGPHGFVGRNIKESLSEKYEFFAPSSSELDMRDYDALARYLDQNRIESVIHSVSSRENTLDSDLRMYFNVERFSDQLDRIIYFGSGAEYDKQFDIINASEEDIGKRIPTDGYGFAKYIMTKHARLSNNIYCLRLFGIFGKYEDWTYKFISNLCCKAVFDLPLTMRRECKFDYIYIDDLPPVVDWLIDGDSPEPEYHDYNLTSGSAVLLSELAKMVLAASGKNLDVIVLNTEGNNNEYTSSNERLKKQLPCFEVTPIQNAIMSLYRYYYDNRDAINYDELSVTK